MPARVFIPPGMRPLCNGAPELEAEGANVREIVISLEQRHEGFFDALVEWTPQGEQLRRGLSIAVNNDVQPLGLRAKVPENAEIHILPAMAGG